MADPNVEENTSKSMTSSPESDKNGLKIIDLPRGGRVVLTSSGPVQLGMPPETIKDSMKLGLEVPRYFMVPSIPFTKALGENMGVNVAEFEFPAYYNFFLKRRNINLIVTSLEMEKRIRQVFQETLFGPSKIDLTCDFPFCAPTLEYPDLVKELAYFRQFGDKLMTIDMLLSFTHFDPKTNIASICDEGIQIEKRDGEFIITDTKENLQANIEDNVTLPKPNFDVTMNVIFKPPAFGITVLGNSHGFDPAGNTSGYVLWINHRGIMIDPPPFSSCILASSNIPPALIDGVIVTHCHADHDAGTFQKVLQEGRVTLITTKTIFGSFLRKYCSLSGFNEKFLRKVLDFRPVRINDPTIIRGAQFRFFYSLHAIPCIGFEVEYGGKKVAFSGDHLNDPIKIQELFDKQIISEYRRDELLAFPWHCDVILHEAGVPPIHTPMKTLENLPADIKERLYVVHTSSRDIPENSGLKSPMEGVENTIRIKVTSPPNAQALQVLEIVEKIPIFSKLTLSDAHEIIQMARKKMYKHQDTVLKHGCVGDRFFVIVAGEATEFIDAEKRRDSFDKESKSKGKVKRISLTGQIAKKFVQGDYFGDQFLLHPGKLVDTNIFCSSAELILFEFDVADFKWLIRNTQTFTKMKILAESHQHLYWEAVQENLVFQNLKSVQRTQLELVIKWRSTKEKEEIRISECAVFIDEGNFSLVQSEVAQVSTPTGSRSGKRRGSNNRVLPLAMAVSTPPMQIVQKSFTKGAFVGDVDGMMHYENEESGIAKSISEVDLKIVSDKDGSIFYISKEDFRNFLSQNPGILMALTGLKYAV